MANISPRPSIGTSTGLVTYVDSAGNARPALVDFDYAVNSSAANLGCVDLSYVDPAPADVQPASRLDPPARGRNVISADSVPDSTNAGVVTTPTATVTSGATSFSVTSATGIPAAGFVTGAGIAQTTITNPAATVNPLNPDLPATIPAGTAYTISGTTVTLANGTTAGLTTSTSLFFSAQPTNYWRFPTTYTI
jgi:hypothetical protein